MTEAQLRAILSAGENDSVEFTQSLTNIDKFSEAICAFANNLGDAPGPGYLVIGVDDSGTPTGHPISERQMEAVVGIRSDGNVSPPPPMFVHRLKLGDADVLVIEVTRSEAPPVRYKGRICVRAGPRRGYATAEEERRLSERRLLNHASWDYRACLGATLDDLATELFTGGYLPRAIAREVLEENGRSLAEQLAALRLYDQRKQAPTNGALLLFGKNPLYFFPNAYVQYVRYGGLDQSAVVEQEIRYDHELGTTMRRLDELAGTINIRRPQRQPDLSDMDVSTYPQVALHEVFMNAVIHRDYESQSPVMINHFQDRIEILNPGSLMDGISVSELPGRVAYRNPLLAEAAKVLGYVNRFGRGIAIAKSLLEKNGNPPPEFVSNAHFFLATIRARP